MHGLVESARNARGSAIIAVESADLPRVTRALGADAGRWIVANDFRGTPGSFLLVPDARGQARAVLVAIARADDILALAALPQKLPPGKYRLDPSSTLDPRCAALGWGMGAYQFTRYRKAAREPAQLLVDGDVAQSAQALLAAIWQVRDLVNTPTEDLGPQQLADAV